MRKIILLLALLLCFSVSLVTLSGCAKKEAETKTEEAAEMEEAATDTTEAEVEAETTMGD